MIHKKLVSIYNCTPIGGDMYVGCSDWPKWGITNLASSLLGIQHHHQTDS